MGELFHTCPDRPWDPPSLLHNGYRVFPGGKERPGRDADPSPPSSAVVKKEYSYMSTPLMGRTACTEPQCLYKGALYLTITCKFVSPWKFISIHVKTIHQCLFRLATDMFILSSVEILYRVLRKPVKFICSIEVGGPESRSRYSDSLRAGRIPVGPRFSAPVHIGPVTHPASYSVYLIFPDGKVGRGVAKTTHTI